MTKPRRDPPRGQSWADQVIAEQRRLHPELGLDTGPVEDLRLDENEDLYDVDDRGMDDPDVHLRKQADRHDERRHR